MMFYSCTILYQLPYQAIYYFVVCCFSVVYELFKIRHNKKPYRFERVKAIVLKGWGQL